MADNTQPEALRLADRLHHEQPTVLRIDAEHAGEELRRQHTRIAELEARIKTMAEEHADELMVAHLDGRMRAAQPAPQQEAQYNHGPQAETVAEAARDVGKWLNERPNRPIDLRHVAMLCAHAQAQAAPVLTSATGGDWTQPTTVAQRLGDAMQLLCGGKRPPDELVSGWLDNTSEELQSFAASNGPAWAQGIGLIDAAMVMVNQPTEITTIDNPGRDHEHRAARAPADSVTAPAGGAVAGPTSDLHPEKCPITGRPFFMTLDHPELGRVPTYGGPYDSYTIPAPEGEPTDPWHERELRSERYDHDAGWWVEGGEPIPLRIVHEDVLFELQEDAEAAAAPTPPAQAADSVLEDAARLDWLLLHISGAEFRRIGVHYSGNARRADVDTARKQGANHD